MNQWSTQSGSTFAQLCNTLVPSLDDLQMDKTVLTVDNDERMSQTEELKRARQTPACIFANVSLAIGSGLLLTGLPSLLLTMHKR